MDTVTRLCDGRVGNRLDPFTPLGWLAAITSETTCIPFVSTLRLERIEAKPASAERSLDVSSDAGDPGSGSKLPVAQRHGGSVEREAPRRCIRNLHKEPLPVALGPLYSRIFMHRHDCR